MRVFANKKITLFIFFFLYLLGFDLATKYVAEKTLIQPFTISKNIVEYANKGYLLQELYPEGQKFWIFKKEIFMGFFIHYVRNFDIGFSAFSNLNIFTKKTDSQLSKIVLFVQLFALIIILLFFFLGNLEYYWAFVFVISGGAGNIINRFYSGYVIDFIAFETKFFNFLPIFNIADVYVTIGALLFIGEFFLRNKNRSTKRLS